MKSSLSFSVLKKYMHFQLFSRFQLHYSNVLLIVQKVKKLNKEYFYFIALILFSRLKKSSSNEFLYKSIKEIIRQYFMNDITSR